MISREAEPQLRLRDVQERGCIEGALIVPAGLQAEPGDEPTEGDRDAAPVSDARGGIWGVNSTVPGERHWIGFIVATVLMVVGAAVSFVLVRRWTATRSR